MLFSIPPGNQPFGPNKYGGFRTWGYSKWLVYNPNGLFLEFPQLCNQPFKEYPHDSGNRLPALSSECRRWSRTAKKSWKTRPVSGEILGIPRGNIFMILGIMAMDMDTMVI